MRYSRALLPTVKEVPADAITISHILLLRAGYIRRVGAGIYSFLPMGFRVLSKIERLIESEMDRAGAERLLLPAFLPAEFFRETGRWDLYGDTLLRLKDRKGGDYHLGPTHEEIITDLARREIHSWRDLPKNLYQIQTKFRDEPRPRAGLLRCREFLMKDAYSFDADEAGALQSYETMRQAYVRIFDRTGLTYRMVSADSGSIGGSQSAEFQVLVDSGEDEIVACLACDYAANTEVASAPALSPEGPEMASVPAVEAVSTPHQKTIEQVSTFLKAGASSFLKSLIYRAEKELVLAIVRGDHEVNEVKLARSLGVTEVTLAEGPEVEKITGAVVGFAGPVGFQGKVIVDRDAASISDAITGANRNDTHLRHVQYGRDYQGEIAQIRKVMAGDACPKCGAPLKNFRGIEAGHIFVLGTHYSATMDAWYLDKEQKKRLMVMGCYGIGVSRLVAAAVEQHHDAEGLCWPMRIAPYPVHIVQLGDSEGVVKAVNDLEAALLARGIETLIDDRDERPGVKFKDADLIGIPLRVTIGEKALAEGKLELKPRSEKNPKNAERIPLAEAAETLSNRIRELLGD